MDTSIHLSFAAAPPESSINGLDRANQSALDDQGCNDDKQGEGQSGNGQCS